MPILSTFSSISIKSLKNTLVAVGLWPQQSSLTGVNSSIKNIGNGGGYQNGIISYTLPYGGYTSAGAMSSNGDTVVLPGSQGSGNILPTGFSDLRCFYVLQRTNKTWSLETILSPMLPDGLLNASSNLAHQLDISGDGNTIVITNPITYNPTTVPSFVTYKKSGVSWVLESTTTINDNRLECDLAVKLNYDGTTAAIRTSYDDVYVFTKSGTAWSQQSKLVPNTGINGSRSPNSLSISPSGNIIVMGSLTLNSAYVFTKSGASWSQTNLTGNGSFGVSVSISGDERTIAVGAPSTTPLPDYTGQAYQSGVAFIFKFNGTSWVQQAILKPKTPIYQSGFGTSISLNHDGNVVMIGRKGTSYEVKYLNPSSPGAISTAVCFGSAFIFRYSTNWEQEAELQGNPYVPVNSGLQSTSYTGQIIDISDDGNTVLSTGSGQAYVFVYK